MELGFIILAHENLHRVEQLARHLAAQGCPSCIHIDKNTPDSENQHLINQLSDTPNVIFSHRTACEWGRFTIVDATQKAALALLEKFPKITNTCLISGSCLPIRPVRQLQKFLQRNIHTDFIESVSVKNNFWVKGGLNEERFTLYFPFSWRKQRLLFDRSVDLQRALKVERKIPDGLTPHIGSQWWCLTTKTLRRILNDPRKPHYDRYFKSSWIPDESYFQTLARKHAVKIESRSLTFSKFDFSGKPYTFYDDHLDILPLSDCFMGRKMWSGANKLYDTLLESKRPNHPMTKSRPKEIAAIFESADQNRCAGGEGRYHQGRFPLRQAPQSGVSQEPYTAFIGFKNLFQQFPDWVEQNTNTYAHGSIFARTNVAGIPKEDNLAGNLPAEPAIRNRNSAGFLSNFLWKNRDRHQSFLIDFRDYTRVMGTIAHDSSATIVLVRHSWLLLLLNRKASFANILATAKRFHRLEQELMDQFSKVENGCKVVILDLDTAVHNPAEMLVLAIDHMGGKRNAHLRALPVMQNLDGLDLMVRKLRNNGLRLKFEHRRVAKGNPSENSDGFAKPYAVK